MREVKAEANEISAGENYYRRHASELLGQYESVHFETVHADLAAAIVGMRGNALDVGCGSGRDAAWLADKGWSVVAIDPSAEMLEGARRLHANAGITWLQDALPSLDRVIALGIIFDLILLSAVWMHVPETGREDAVRNVTSLCSENALIYLTLRSGPADPERGFFDTRISELIAAFERHGMRQVGETIDADAFGRQDVQWRKIALKKAA